MFLRLYKNGSTANDILKSSPNRIAHNDINAIPHINNLQCSFCWLIFVMVIIFMDHRFYSSLVEDRGRPRRRRINASWWWWSLFLFSLFLYWRCLFDPSLLVWIVGLFLHVKCIKICLWNSSIPAELLLFYFISNIATFLMYKLICIIF